MTVTKMTNFALAAVSGLALAACATTMDDEAMADMDGNGAATESSADMDAADEPATVEVGGATMYANRNIIQNATNSPIHTTLVRAVQAAGLVDTLSGPGPFTVFAPTDQAFQNIPAATLQALMQPAARAQLSQILTYHVVPGSLDAAELMRRIEAGGGEAVINSVEGSPLTFTEVNGAVAVTDERGGVGYVTQADVHQSNGIIHVLNNVLLPNMQPAPAPAQPASDAMEDDTGDSM